jgi:hypothetical protein
MERCMHGQWQTPWNEALLEDIVVAWLPKEFCILYGIQLFITMKSTITWDMSLYSLVGVYDYVDECSAFIFRIEE